MPCFKGLAVSIHTPDGPITEYSVQKQARASRISSYVAVPPAKIPPGSTTGKPEQSTFAVSITLLTPGLNIPYSTPKPTPADPNPTPRVVGGLPGYSSERDNFPTTIPPYIPRTANPNETIAAYIYFDGRAKEEVATLLRRGEETWVNSRWVSVPDSEGGGLAEREFLFREVGLERWLNGLDLEGTKDQKAEKIEKRHRRLEKKRRKRQEEMDSDDETPKLSSNRFDRNGVLRYGGEDGSPVEDLPGDDGLLSSDSDSDSDSDDEPPQPEAAGQIKIALFRVLASGEIKRGEYSPQFDAHDDDEMENGASNGDGGGDEIDHTTSFAKPKTLDPKSISTQTVTGLDPHDQPYAVFTFFYRGKKQLEKMGILPNPAAKKAEIPAKRRASGPDFSKLNPLKSAGTVGFTGYRDSANGKRKQSKTVDAMDSDAEDEEDDERLPAGGEIEIRDEAGNVLSPEDASRQERLAEGVQKIKLKRAHSNEPLLEPVSQTRKPPFIRGDDSEGNGTPRSNHSTSANAGTPPDRMSPARSELPAEAIGSPFKKHRASLSGLESTMFAPIDSSATKNPIATANQSSGIAPSQPSGDSLPPTTFARPVEQENKQETKHYWDEEFLSATDKSIAGSKRRTAFGCAITPRHGGYQPVSFDLTLLGSYTRYGQRLLQETGCPGGSSGNRSPFLDSHGDQTEASN